jgi:hypothetical protein
VYSPRLGYSVPSRGTSVKQKLYDNGTCKFYIEVLPDEKVVVHCDMTSLGPESYRKTRDDFEVIKALLRDEGIDTLYALSDELDIKHRKFLRLYGFLIDGEAYLNGEKKLVYQTSTEFGGV